MGDPREPLAAEILRYLLDHPHAKDTAAGIAGWWLQTDYSVSRQDEIRRVLTWLIERDWISVWEAGSSGPIYGLKGENIEAVRAFVKQRQ